MNKRHLMLLGLLAIGGAALAWFLSEEYGASQGQIVGFSLFAALLVAAAIVSLRTESRGQLGITGWAKCVFGSFALTFAIWLLVSTFMLPIFGYAGFELLGKPSFTVAFVVLTILLIPVTRRYLR